MKKSIVLIILLTLLVVLLTVLMTSKAFAQDSTGADAGIIIGSGKWLLGFLDVNLGIINGLSEKNENGEFQVKSDIYLGAGKNFGLINIKNKVGIFMTLQFYSSTDKKFNSIFGLGCLFKEFAIVPALDFNESYMKNGSFFQRHFRIVLSGSLK